MPSGSALRLTDSITQLPRVGPLVAKKLAKLEIETIADLLFHIPNRYEDWTTLTPLGQVRPGAVVTVQGKIDLIHNKRSPRRRMIITEAVLTDTSGSLKAIWFQQAFLTRVLKPGGSYLFSGEVQENQFGLFLNNPAHELLGTTGFKAIYPQTAGITSTLIRQLVDVALQQVVLVDEIPVETRQQFHLIALSQAIQWLHQPKTLEQISQAKQRLQFGELLRYQLRAMSVRRERQDWNAPAIPFNEELARKFVANLPFTLTTGQRKAAWRILQDLEQGKPMRRLLQGDVGSGKTVVAALAMTQAVKAGWQTVLLAPTEILAQQHFKTISTLLSPFGVDVVLATSGWDQDTNHQVCIGTHALLQPGTRFSHLGLLVIDEEHRFGVNQRQTLAGTSESKSAPHVLSMTATPIPRTLALTVYGGVDVTYIPDKPVGRKLVTTLVRHAGERRQTIQDIEVAVQQGHGVFVVCPLINPSDLLGVSSTQAEAKRLQADLPGIKIGVLHGRLKTEEKQRLMNDFHQNHLDILVATAVIEVGVDVPRATLMVVEGAERFGLAQLHQLRGRVGRSELPSTCILHPSAGTPAPERLHILETTHNGYELAEHDLRLRGMGELFGTKQSGTEDWLQFGLPDVQLIEQSQQAAEQLLDQHAELTKRLSGALFV